MKRILKPVTLTARQAKALERAWEVLQYGYVADASNGFEPAKRNTKRDRHAAQVVSDLLDAAGYDDR
ncbi:MAG: hypothetical protein KGL39_58740 [Patescibacteria group bacterium]|nr:hypothetical protein [Patescibacteria group bacterium]